MSYILQILYVDKAARFPLQIPNSTGEIPIATQNQKEKLLNSFITPKAKAHIDQVFGIPLDNKVYYLLFLLYYFSKPRWKLIFFGKGNTLKEFSENNGVIIYDIVGIIQRNLPRGGNCKAQNKFLCGVGEK